MISVKLVRKFGFRRDHTNVSENAQHEGDGNKVAEVWTLPLRCAVFQ